jgi:antitoxin MazE6
MKTAVSLSDSVFKHAEALAHRLGMSRSELYQNAIAEYLAKHRDTKVTERLDAVYSAHPGKVDPKLKKAQRKSVTVDKW